MGFEKPQDYVVALKKLKGFPLTGLEVRDGRLVFASLSHQVSLPLREVRGGDTRWPAMARTSLT